jgi:hypothetical protein
MNLEKRVPMAEQFVREYEGKGDAAAFATELNEIAFGLAQATDNAKLLSKALDWSKRSVATVGLPLQETNMYKDTYACILYKTGKKAEAIKTEEAVVEWAKKANDPDMIKAFNQTLERMKKGEDVFQ